MSQPYINSQVPLDIVVGDSILVKMLEDDTYGRFKENDIFKFIIEQIDVNVNGVNEYRYFFSGPSYFLCIVGQTQALIKKNEIIEIYFVEWSVEGKTCLMQ